MISSLIISENEQRSKIEKIFAVMMVFEWPSMRQVLGEFKAFKTATPGLLSPTHSYKISAITILGGYPKRNKKSDFFEKFFSLEIMTY